MRIKQRFDVPDNIAEYVGRHICALVYSVCCTDAINGYGGLEHYCVEVKHLNETCSRCGYSTLWIHDVPVWKGVQSCNRHSFQKEGYDTVFAFSPKNNDDTLEECFNMWLELNKAYINCGYSCRHFMRFGDF